jgi:hypothetical protein
MENKTIGNPLDQVARGQEEAPRHSLNRTGSKAPRHVHKKYQGAVEQRDRGIDMERYDLWPGLLGKITRGLTRYI